MLSDKEALLERQEAKITDLKDKFIDFMDAHDESLKTIVSRCFTLPTLQFLILTQALLARNINTLLMNRVKRMLHLSCCCVGVAVGVIEGGQPTRV